MNQERRNKLLALTCVLLTVITALIAFIQAEPRTDVDKNKFKVLQPDDINEVILESPDNKVALNYTNAGWKVNNTYAADGNMIRVLFATLMQNEVKRPVPRAVKDSAAASLQRNGVTVTLRANGEVIKRFVAGGNKTKTQAYFMEDGSDEIYIMAIPGYRVYVSGIYELGANGYRNKYVFNFKWENFTGLDVAFPSRPIDNFSVSLQKDYFTIADLPRVDTAKLSAFLNEASLLTVEEFASANAFDTLRSGPPIIQITAFDVAGRKYPLKIYKGEKNGLVPGIVGKEYAYFRPERIRPILRPKSFFVKKGT
jgi:hypothetical protein